MDKKSKAKAARVAKKAKGAPRPRPKKPLSQRGCCGYGALWYALGGFLLATIMRRKGEEKIAQRIKKRPNQMDDDWVAYWKGLICPERRNLAMNLEEFRDIAEKHGVVLTNVTGHYTDLKITTARLLRKSSKFWNRKNPHHTPHYPLYCRDGGNAEWWALHSAGHIQVIRTNESKNQFYVYDQGGKLNEQRMNQWSNARIQSLFRLDFNPLNPEF